jgi:hypothetical protein
MSPHQEIIVALKAEHKQLIKRKLSEDIASTYLVLHLQIVALRARKPMDAKGSLRLEENSS